MIVDLDSRANMTCDAADSSRRRLAIIGCGRSGLITLKTALDWLSDWEIVCFEKSDSTIGCWGNPYPGFVSTSTKYTTQFACFPIFDASVRDDGGESRSEFFCDDEYGQYLQRFADHFALHPHIRLQTSVEHLGRVDNGRADNERADNERADNQRPWELTIRRTAGDQVATTVEQYDAVILCTGLAAQPKQVASDIATLRLSELNHPAGLGHITGKRIVVIGGGESAVDYANRLSRVELGNQVFLSLQSGIRVSPRYHPIRGVPSDFLRNRLMLSIHEDLRNWIGQRFVEMRIKYQERFERWFPAHQKLTQQAGDESQQAIQTRKDWALKLTLAAKDDLFNMFHNKSDDFLNSVAVGRIQIVGPPRDEQLKTFQDFDRSKSINVAPDIVVPAIGFRSTLEELSGGTLRLRDFYLGCLHVDHSGLFLVGFARPIIGNIPSISEMQAQFVCRLIAGQVQPDQHMRRNHERDQRRNRQRFSKLNLDAIYPVEMFSYCDQLARRMNLYPSVRCVGSIQRWCQIQLTPASTLHYFRSDQADRQSPKSAPIYMPPLFVLLLMALKPVDLLYRFTRAFRLSN